MSDTDRGSQFINVEFTALLKAHGIQISMDERGRCHDSIFVERWWRTVKHERVCLRPCENGSGQKKSLTACLECCCRRRPHQSPNWQTPDETSFGALANTPEKWGLFFSPRRLCGRPLPPLLESIYTGSTRVSCGSARAAGSPPPIRGWRR